MAHIHLPDGAFSIQWVIIWFAVAALVIGAVIIRYRRSYTNDVSKLSIASVLTALAFAIFQIEIPLFGGVHLNLTPLLGIILGPVLGIMSTLVVNIFSAALGHGGWSLLGANFLVNSLEVVVGYCIFMLLKNKIKSNFSLASFSALIALTMGNVMMVAIIGISGIQGSSLTSIEIIQNLLPLVMLNLAVAVVESTITGFTVSYSSKVKPDLLPSYKQKVTAP